MKEIKKAIIMKTNRRLNSIINNLPNLLADKIASLFESIHLGIPGAESRGHANDSSSTPHH
jgi:hypothetical protein